MKHTLLLLTIVASLLSCSDDSGDEKKTNELEVPDQSKFEICECSELESEGKLKTKNDDPFSGTCFSNYPEMEVKYEEYFYYKGVMQSSKFFGKDGRLLTETKYKDGVAIPDVQICDCADMSFKKEKGIMIGYLNNKVYTGFCSSNYPDSRQVYMEEQFEDGKRIGQSVVYNKQGKYLSIGQYKDGQRHGSNVVHNRNGDILYVEYYKKGELYRTDKY